MTKKHFITCLIIIVGFFLLTNLQYLPGPRFMFLTAVLTRFILTNIYVAIFILVLPVLTILLIVD